MNREDALNGDRWHYGNCAKTTGPRGGVKVQTMEVRRSGANKTWKTRPDDFRVPVKYGMYESGEIVPANVAQFHTPETCPLLDGADHSKNEAHVVRVQPVTYSMLPDMTFYRPVCTCGYTEHAVRSEVDAIRMLQAHRLRSVGYTQSDAVLGAELLRDSDVDMVCDAYDAQHAYSELNAIEREGK